MDSPKYLFLSFLLSLTAATPAPAPSPAPGATEPSPNITAIFAFGDSTLDAGNNNVLPTIFRSDHRPYGLDFPGRAPSGRFTDGKLATDILVDALGIKPLLPAYLDPDLTVSDLMTGASFASAGTGLDDSTAGLANVLTMDQQLEYFQQALARMRKAAGEAAVQSALFVVSVGSNDMMFNYYGVPPLMRNYSLSEYQDFLLGNLRSFVQKLVSMGARKVAVMGLPPIGCLPVQIASAGLQLKRKCVAGQNIDSEDYNSKLQFLLAQLQPMLPAGSRLAYADIYTPLRRMIMAPQAYGFVRKVKGCCGTGFMEMGPLCNPTTPVCPNPSKSIFWDAVHPSQTTYTILAINFMHTVIPTLY